MLLIGSPPVKLILGNLELNLEKGIWGLAIDWIVYVWIHPPQEWIWFICEIGIYSQAIGNED